MAQKTFTVECTDEARQQWAPYDRMLRQWLATDPAGTPALIEAVVERIRPVFLKWVSTANANPLPGGPVALAGNGWSVHMPGAQGHALARIEQWIATLTFGLLQELAARDAALVAASQVRPAQ